MDRLIQKTIDYKTSAEVYFDQRNIKKAHYFANKAYRLNPTLYGVRDLAVALDVIICAEKQVKAAGTEVQKNSKEFNRKLIGLQPYCDYDTTRSHFKKLVYIVHPDRNRSVAALMAFMILNEAWSYLRHRETPKDKVDGNYFHENLAEAGPTFWTVCTECYTQFEYSVDVCKKHVRCIQCRGHFLAVDILKPPPLCDQLAVGTSKEWHNKASNSVSDSPTPLTNQHPKGN